VSTLVNEENNPTYKEIKTLPCFAQVYCNVTPIIGGESHACFKVTFSKDGTETSYFVKSLAGHQETAKAEVAVNLLAAEAGFAPAIVYHSPLWLVCEYIHGESLEKVSVKKPSITSNNKIMIAMNLMSKVHQLKHPNNHPILSIKELLLNLAAEIKATHLQQAFVNEVIKKIMPLQLTSDNLILCHGDVNYENIRLSDSFNKDYLLDKTWLVDFECTCLAEAEYDIAMFIAINALIAEDVETVIKRYQQYTLISIDGAKVRTYLACCYLINGLWYLKLAIDDKKNLIARLKSRQQLVFFDQLMLLKNQAANFFDGLI
jgi:thiamine kinase-like enzyme